MTNGNNIGIDRRLDLEWLDAVAGKVAAGASEPEIRAFLFRLLDGLVAGGNRRGTACHKTVGILVRVWVDVAPVVQPIRDRAMTLLHGASPEQRLALHWAMLTATYPFFHDAAKTTGRLLALQGNVTLAQLTQRMRETWGDRSTVVRAMRRVVRSMVQWGALLDSAVRGTYQSPSKPIAVEPVAATLLLEALLLRSSDQYLPVASALRSPALFPFLLSLSLEDIRRSHRLELSRQGLDQDLVTVASHTH